MSPQEQLIEVVAFVRHLVRIDPGYRQHLDYIPLLEDLLLCHEHCLKGTFSDEHLNGLYVRLKHLITG